MGKVGLDTVAIKMYFTKLMSKVVTDHTRNFDKMDGKSSALLPGRVVEIVDTEPERICCYVTDKGMYSGCYST